MFNIDHCDDLDAEWRERQELIALVQGGRDSHGHGRERSCVRGCIPDHAGRGPDGATQGYPCWTPGFARRHTPLLSSGTNADPG